MAAVWAATHFLTPQHSLMSKDFEQAVPGTIWTFEQEQTFALTNVSTVVRMTVVKLKSGGLFVYAPIAPTA